MNLVAFVAFVEGKDVYINPDQVRLVTVSDITVAGKPIPRVTSILFDGGLSYFVRGSLNETVARLVGLDKFGAGDYSDWEQWEGPGSPALPAGTPVLIHTAIGDSPDPVPVENVDWSVPDPKGPGTVLAYKVVQ